MRSWESNSHRLCRVPFPRTGCFTLWFRDRRIIMHCSPPKPPARKAPAQTLSGAAGTAPCHGVLFYTYNILMYFIIISIPYSWTTCRSAAPTGPTVRTPTAAPVRYLPPVACPHSRKWNTDWLRTTLTKRVGDHF